MDEKATYYKTVKLNGDIYISRRFKSSVKEPQLYKMNKGWIDSRYILNALLNGEASDEDIIEEDEANAIIASLFT
jgi:hypothetical protein